MHIAMWSGPRNLSTALMYSFAQRADTRVIDEPFYAAFLERTGATHPMRSEVLQAQSSDPADVIQSLLSEGLTPNVYSKQMAHHMVEGVPLDWVSECTNVYLLRHPARVIASYQRLNNMPTRMDLGAAKLGEIYARWPGPVIDSKDIKTRPREILSRLCAELGLAFDLAMLTWDSGGRPEDGIWAKHWYANVHKSTGFVGTEEEPLPVITGDIYEEALDVYQTMSEKALKL